MSTAVGYAAEMNITTAVAAREVVIIGWVGWTGGARKKLNEFGYWGTMAGNGACVGCVWGVWVFVWLVECPML